MFGYVRPLKGELRVREYEAFRIAYCGLCHSLRRQGGAAARYVVNYDFTFLAMLLMGDTPACVVKRRCPVHPFRRRRCLESCAELEKAADCSLILSWWKLRDTLEDEGFWRSVPARLALLFLRRAYRRASRREADFDGAVSARLADLSRMERLGESSLDRQADCSAVILRSCAETVGDEERRRVLEELFYHVGRFVYILDAVEDLPEDLRRERPNPLRERCGADGKLPEEEREELQLTLDLSLQRISAAYQLLGQGPWSGILENIIYLGMPEAKNLVFAGRWKRRRRGNEEAALPNNEAFGENE